MSGPVPYWSDGQVTLHLGDCLDILPLLPEASIDSIVTDPPYGLEFMGKEWDGADGFRRSLNPADAGRDSVFGRTSRTSPEYRTGSEKWRAGAGMSKPGIGDRPTEWPSFGGRDSANATCASCGGRMRGARRCACPEPDWRVKGEPLDGRAGQAQMHLFQRWCESWAAECLRVLKPGAFMLVFGGARTFHRLTCGIEDAGFEIRDPFADLTGFDGPGLVWVHSQGFAKNLDAARAIDMYLCQLPGKHRMRSVPPDAGPDDHVCPETPESEPWRGWGTAWKPAWEPVVVARKPMAGTLAVNLLAHEVGAVNIDGCRVPPTGESRGRDGEASQFTRYTDRGGTNFAALPGVRGGDPDGRWPPNLLLGELAAEGLDRQRPGEGVSRRFPVFYSAKAPSAERPRLEDGTSWPTVKPRELIQLLCRSVTPPRGKVLDLFAGTGPVGEACIIEGFDCVLIDKDPTAMALMRERLSKDIQPDLFGSGGAA